MITDGVKWNYCVRSLSALFKGITSNHNEEFYCLNCFYSYRTYCKLKRHKKVYHKYDHCYIDMSNEGNKILKCIQGEKSLKISFPIYSDFEF